MQKVQIIYIYNHDIGFYWWSFDKHPSLFSDSNLLYARSILISTTCVPRAIFWNMTSRRTWNNAIGYQNSKLLGPSPTIWFISPINPGGVLQGSNISFSHTLGPIQASRPSALKKLPFRLISLMPWFTCKASAMASNCQPERLSKFTHQKKKDGSNLSTSVESLAMRLHLDESSRSSVTQLTPNTYRNGHRSLGMDENLDHLPPHDTSFQMINYCTLCPLYIHALVHFEVLSHHIKNIHVSYFPALIPLTWMWFRCRSSRATVRFIFKASAKAWRALENKWNFWILPFLLGKSCSKIKSSYPFAKRLFFRSCSHQCRQNRPLQLRRMTTKQNMSKFLPHVDGFHCGAENSFNKMTPTEQGRLNNPTVLSGSSQTKVPWHQGLQVPCYADWAKWHFGSSSMQEAMTSTTRACWLENVSIKWVFRKHLQLPTQTLGVSLGIQENASSLATPTSRVPQWLAFIASSPISLPLRYSSLMLWFRLSASAMASQRARDQPPPQCGVVIPMPHLGTLWANKIGL